MNRKLACILFLWCLGISSAIPGRELPQIPDSLAAWYRPQNERQRWLHNMFSLRRALQAMEYYGAEQDWPRLQKWTKRLLEHYRRIPEMVPEWADEVELVWATRLERAAAQRDLPGLKRSLRRIKSTCRSCHREYRALVAARFRSPDFSQQKVPDGQGGEQDYGRAMKGLSYALNGIKIASEDDRWPSAEKAGAELRERLQRLGEGCGACHRDPTVRTQILGASSQAMLRELEQAIRARDGRQTGRQLGTVAVRICARCHGIHRTLSDLRHMLFP